MHILFGSQPSIQVSFYYQPMLGKILTTLRTPFSYVSLRVRERPPRQEDGACHPPSTRREHQRIAGLLPSEVVLLTPSSAHRQFIAVGYSADRRRRWLFLCFGCKKWVSRALPTPVMAVAVVLIFERLITSIHGARATWMSDIFAGQQRITVLAPTAPMLVAPAWITKHHNASTPVDYAFVARTGPAAWL